MDVIGGAVEGVDDPGRRGAGAGAALGGVLLLAEEGVAGEAFVEVGEDGLLRAEVGFGDEVGAALFPHAEAAAPLLQHGGAAPGRLAGRSQVVRQVVRGHSSSPGKEN